MLTWVQFVGCTIVILVTGTRLARYGDVLAEKSGLGHTWIGIVLMASVTSLPELVSGLSSILIFDVPDIAVGDVVGSCMFNLLILAFLDLGHGLPLARRIHQGHVLSAGFGVLLMAVASLNMLTGTRAPAIGWVGVYSVVCLGLYLVAMRLIFLHERQRTAQLPLDERDLRHEGLSMRRALVLYGVNALFLIAAATYLPGLGERLAVTTGLGQTFVGSIFVAFSTSLPEVVVSVEAARIGAVDMAVGNLFGSNLFNLAILGIDDLVYVKGPILAAASSAHLLTLTAAVAMTAISLVSVYYRVGAKRFRLTWDSAGLIAIYGTTVALLYQSR